MSRRIIYLIYFLFYSISAYEENFSCENTICEPKAGNLLIGRESQLSASSTCGLNKIETFCVVTPQGESECKACASAQPWNEVTNPESHKIENVVPSNPRKKGRWWQSENGVNNVTIQINLETQFQLLSTYLRFKTYRPAAMYVERSDDFGRSWKKYQYFSNNCERDFPAIPMGPRKKLEDVVCTEKYSLLTPSEEGLVNYVVAPNHYKQKHDLYSKYIQNFTAITTLRVTFVRLHTLGDTNIDRSDLLKRKYYYALYEWFVYGRCSCFGHASECIPKSFRENKKPYKVYGVCRCKHNTTGDNCESCMPFYMNKPWQPATSTSPNSCEICNCNDHSNECSFNSIIYAASGNKSGGHCQNCQHNTEGDNCQFCKPMYYRNKDVPINHPDTCLKCECLTDGVRTSDQFCDQYSDVEKNTEAGNCKCKENVTGQRCDQCKSGYYNLDRNNAKGCTPCQCHMLGTIDNRGCDPHTGSCQCKRYTSGDLCDHCIQGYFNLTNSVGGCQPCACNPTGSINQQCDSLTGDCVCKPFYTGRDCSQLLEGYYSQPPDGDPDNTDIIIDPPGNGGDHVVVLEIDPKDFKSEDTVQIDIKPEQLNNKECKPSTQTFNIDQNTDKLILNDVCLEKSEPIKIKVDRKYGPDNKIIISNIYLLPITDDMKYVDPRHCEQFREVYAKKKNGTATNEELLSITPECEPYLAKDYRSWKDTGSTAQRCDCNVTGSIDISCDKETGQCSCKPGVTGKHCDSCLPFHVGFGSTGCTACNCSVSGSTDRMCDENGKCPCKDGIIGDKCDNCPDGYWNFPNCMPCECNGLSDTCDLKTGECNNCIDNSSGPRCEVCAEGFYGDPMSDVKCQPCSCPGGGVNHAIGCKYDHVNKGMSCLCKPGYTGPTCSQCANNYYGNPSEVGGECKKCDCSDNESPYNACDQITGDCIDCMNNSKGQNCEICSDGYYGDATKQSCMACNCYFLGSEDVDKCDPNNGQCTCLPFVTGSRCSECKENYFNMTYGIGCQSCGCDPYGSYDLKCDDNGQCNCKPDRTGLKCDSCPYNKYGNPNTQEGCKDCDCDYRGSTSMTCDSKTGQCPCREGIVGLKCDQCDRGTEGELPNCRPCGECWNDWDSTITKLVDQINEIIKSGKSPMPSEIKYELSSLMNLLTILESLKEHELKEDSQIKMIDQIERLETQVQKIEEQGLKKSDDFSINLLETKEKTTDEYLKFQKELSDLKAFYNETVYKSDAYIASNPRAAFAEARNLFYKIGPVSIEREKIVETNSSYNQYFDNIKRQYQLQSTKSRKVKGDLNKIQSTIYEMNKRMCGQVSQEAMDQLKEKGNLCPSICGGVGCALIDQAIGALQTLQTLSHIEYNPFTFTARSAYNVGSTSKNIYRPNGSPLGIGHHAMCGALDACNPNIESKVRSILQDVKVLEESMSDTLSKFGDAQDVLGKLKETQDNIIADVDGIENVIETSQKRLQQKNLELSLKINKTTEEMNTMKYYTKSNYSSTIEEIQRADKSAHIDIAYQLSGDLNQRLNMLEPKVRLVIQETAANRSKIEDLLKISEEIEQSSTKYAKQFTLLNDAKEMYSSILNSGNTDILNEADYVEKSLKLNDTSDDLLERSKTFRQTSRDLYDQLRSSYEASDEMYKEAFEAQTNIKLNSDKLKTAHNDLNAMDAELAEIKVKLDDQKKPDSSQPSESDSLTQEAKQYAEEISKYKEELKVLQEKIDLSMQQETDMIKKLKTSKENIRNILRSMHQSVKLPKYNSP